MLELCGYNVGRGLTTNDAVGREGRIPNRRKSREQRERRFVGGVDSYLPRLKRLNQGLRAIECRLRSEVRKVRSLFLVAVHLVVAGAGCWDFS